MLMAARLTGNPAVNIFPLVSIVVYEQSDSHPAHVQRDETYGYIWTDGNLVVYFEPIVSGQSCKHKMLSGLSKAKPSDFVC